MLRAQYVTGTSVSWPRRIKVLAISTNSGLETVLVVHSTNTVWEEILQRRDFIELSVGYLRRVREVV
jgi:hypothetical protein